MAQSKPQARTEVASAPSGIDARESASGAGRREAVGVHLVGSVPLRDAEEVFRRAAEMLGDRLRRIPDGETGPRSDWILWQYPAFSSRPQFEIGPPGDGGYRTLPKLRLRPDESGRAVRFENLGYADTAIASYRLFARLKRDGVIPRHCRFLVSLPTPLAPVSAFVAPEHQSQIEPIYEAKMLEEVTEILQAVPADQLAIQWDARVEFAMLEGSVPTWFTEVRAATLERLLRLSMHIPRGVELGFHLCYGDEAHGHFVKLEDIGNLVEIANALAASLSRPLNWIHMPIPPGVLDAEALAPLGALALHPETELYLGLIHRSDGIAGATQRIAAAGRHVEHFGAASDCGWGRGGSVAVEALLDLHRAVSLELPETERVTQAAHFEWPEGFVPVPDEDWTRQAVDAVGLAYDQVDDHGWYSNLNPTVEDLAANLHDGDIMLDYSGGTGILLDRLRLRIFDRQVGLLIVDAGAKFLSVALEKYRDDPRVGARLLRFLRDEKRLQTLDEVLGPVMMERGVDVIVAANAIHLYQDLDEVADAWVRALRPGGKVFINSGNLRNPRAAPGEWILDETVWVINDLAEALVRSNPTWERYRGVLDDNARMAAHAKQRDRVFLKPRPLAFYTDSLTRAGLTVTDVREATIKADVMEWFELMTAYHDAVLGWVGGTKKLDGEDPTPEAVEDRLTIMRQALDTIFGGRAHFNACWTYISAVRAA